jgi:hypothetical protein
MSGAELGGKALWTLMPIGAMYGVVAVVVFRRFAGKAPIRRLVNQVLAHVMELGLFLDSPGLVLGAARDLLRANVRLLRLVILPGGILALLFAFLFPVLNAIYGRAPLPAGEASVVTIQMKDGAMPAVQLEAPAGIVVETPGVRVLRDRQISWRVRPLRQSSGGLKFRIQDRVVTANMHGFFLRDPAIRSIEIRYPKAAILGLPWLAWFAIGSSVAAVVFGLCWRR